MLAFRPNTIGSDINPHTIKYCNDRGLDARLMSSGSLPFTDQQFDSVLLDNVIEHIEDPTFLLDEIFRVLKSDGILLVGVPGIRGWKSDSDHKIAYDVVNLVSLLSDSHFRRDEIFFTPLWESNWLSKNLKQYCIYGKFIKVNCERNC
jgi:ubiquinone/menaquinone biosynthesis C-methylase UbiE